MSPKPKAPRSGQHIHVPKFVKDDIGFLFSDLTTPETSVKFDPPSRANPATIQRNIDPPAATWIWPDEAARRLHAVTSTDIGKYGLQSDIATLFKLIGVSPQSVWQAVQNFTQATWTWLNLTARLAEKVTEGDVGKVGIQSDIDTYFQLAGATPPVWRPIPDPTATASPLELSTGASDADSYHDFFRLQIAFEDVWAELLDSRIVQMGRQLYATWDALMDASPGAFDDSGATDRRERFSMPPGDDIAGIGELQTFIQNLQIVLGVPTTTPPAVGAGLSAQISALKDAVTKTLQGCNMVLTELNRAGAHSGTAAWDAANWLAASSGHNDNTVNPDDLAQFPGVLRMNVFNSIMQTLNAFTTPQTPGGGGTPPTVTFPDVTTLLAKLSDLLKERYRFDVFAPASINYGLLLNYRQHWQPQSYQVGNLVSTIPLAPQETRRYTTKTIVKKSRSVKEIDDALRSGKDESSTTMRVDAEIVDRAKNQTNFQTNANGSYGNGNIYKVEAGLQLGKDQAVESAQTKREFHESVLKSAQEYRNEHRIEITTEESREEETTTFQEIRNPNDELTVTYLFYELQRRYLVDESLYKATPVLLVANEVPAPHEIDQSWLLRHDWIIKRTILDNSFLPALEYLATDYTGEEVTLQVLEMAVQHQKGVVDKISQQVLLANQSLAAATAGLTDSQNQEINDFKTAETVALVKSIFDPLGITQAQKVDDGNSDRARIDFAKDALNRAQAKADQLTGGLQTEMTALQTTKHFSMLAEIDRLRLHVKDNIIYYMQAIWTYEPSDQRYFRLYNLDVPVFGHNTQVYAAPTTAVSSMSVRGQSSHVSFPPPTLLPEAMKLHQVADLDTFIGFKGNYMIFPLVNFDNYMAWYLMQNYIHFDPVAGLIARDPDPGAGFTLDNLQTAMSEIYKNDPASFSQHEAEFEEVMLRLLSDETPRMVTVPSSSLYIEALPGTHPLLEDFKLIHRAIDIKRAQAEARKAELENLRLATRLENGQLGDPDIDKVVVVDSRQKLTVDAGQ